MLALYREWRQRRRNRNTSAETFLYQLMQSWQVTVPPDPADEINAYTYHQATVGLAFAQLKLHADCDPGIASLAMQSLREQPEHELTRQLLAILENYI